MGRQGLLLVCVLLAAGRSAAAEPPASLGPVDQVAQGYRLMYNLQFSAAQQQFAEWQRENPSQPLGGVSQAANLLFSELARLGVLEAQFFVHDSSFTSHQKLAPDAALKARFDADLSATEQQARRQLSANARNPDALFVLAMVFGLRADYAVLIEKKNMASLSDTRQASEWAAQVLAVDPSYSDAYLATGIAKYIVGSVVAPVRWILEMRGYTADKQQGIQDMKVAAEKARYLGPFARILLAVAALRDHNPQEARRLLVGLQQEFPSNPLFAREIARIDHPQVGDTP